MRTLGSFVPTAHINAFLHVDGKTTSERKSLTGTLLFNNSHLRHRTLLALFDQIWQVQVESSIQHLGGRGSCNAKDTLLSVSFSIA